MGYRILLAMDMFSLSISHRDATASVNQTTLAISLYFAGRLESCSPFDGLYGVVCFSMQSVNKDASTGGKRMIMSDSPSLSVPDIGMVHFCLSLTLFIVNLLLI